MVPGTNIGDGEPVIYSVPPNSLLRVLFYD